MRSTLFRVQKPKCPMCDAAGIRKTGLNFFHDKSVLRCLSCHHEWEIAIGRSGALGTNRVNNRASRKDAP